MVKEVTNKDIETLVEGINTPYDTELDFVFTDKSRIHDVVAITFDDKKLYLLTKKNLALDLRKSFGDINEYVVNHSITFKNRDHAGWQTGIRNPLISDYLPKDNSLRYISGGSLTNFINFQASKNNKYNPFVTKESYLATIVHEFGHMYYNSSKLTWYSDREENISYYKNALDILKTRETEEKKTHLRIEHPQYISELFAFCTDRTASQLFWPQHLKDTNKYLERHLERQLEAERLKDLSKEDSTLSENTHIFAATVGLNIMARYDSSWPMKILEIGQI